MARTPTPKQIKFVQKYIELGEATAAYREAYNAENMLEATVTRKAFELVHETPTVTAMIRQAKDELAKRHEITVESVKERLFALGDKAEQAGQLGQALKAEELKMRLGGLGERERADTNVTVNLESKPDFARALGSASNAAHTQEQGSKADPTKH